MSLALALVLLLASCASKGYLYAGEGLNYEERLEKCLREHGYAWGPEACEKAVRASKEEGRDVIIIRQPPPPVKLYSPPTPSGPPGAPTRIHQ